MAGTTNMTSSDATRCYAREAQAVGPPLFDHGQINFQTYHLGWLISFVFAIIAWVASFWLINKHIQWYTNKKEQRYIVRILFMVPIYAAISFASFLFWNHSTPLVLLRDCYESIVLTAFFYLLLTYISPNLEEQKEIFLKVGLSRSHDLKRKRKGDPPQKWVFPLGFIKWKPADGLYFLQLMKWGVLQYCVIRPTTTLAAVILNYVGLYCEESWSPGWAHIYLTVIMSLSVTVAMYCLIQIYVTISEPLKPQKPLLKLFAIKAVVFLTFWQAVLLSLLTMLGVVKDTKYMTAANINIGIGAIAECVEMTMFAFLHIKCFSYKVYLPDPTTFSGDILDQRTPRLRSLGHAMNFKETFVELWRGCVYMVRHIRGKETDKMIRRTVIMEGAFGRSRITVREAYKELPPAEKLDSVDVSIVAEETVHINGERQWLGVGDNYGYGLGYINREKSDGLGDQIEKELNKLGYSTRERARDGADNHDVDVEQGHLRGHRSWWRSIYDRISQSGPDESLTPVLKRKSVSRPRNVISKPLGHAYDDPPPVSSLWKYRDQAGSRPAWPKEFSGKATEIPLYGVPNRSGGHIQLDSPSNLVIQDSRITQPAVPPRLARSDSLLARVFPYARTTSDLQSNSASVDGLTSSAQSHKTQVRITAEPMLIPNASVSSKVPDVVEASESNLGGEAEGPTSQQARVDEDHANPPSTSNGSQRPESLRRSYHVRGSTRSTSLLAPLPLAPFRSPSDFANANPMRSRHFKLQEANSARDAVPNPSTSSPAFYPHPPQRSPPRTGSRLHNMSVRPSRSQLTIPSPLAPVSKFGFGFSYGDSPVSTSPADDAKMPSSALPSPQTSQPPQKSHFRSPVKARASTSPLSSFPPSLPTNRPTRSNAVRRISLEPSHGPRKYSLESRSLPVPGVYPQDSRTAR